MIALRPAQDPRETPGRQTRPDLAITSHPNAARTIAAFLALRDQVIARIIAGVRSQRMGRKPITGTPVDRDYEKQRQHRQHLVDQDLASS